MGVGAYFSEDYQRARGTFLAHAESRQGQIVTYENPHARGPGGETLATDAAYFGTPDATRLLILISGTHGVEGLCGSGIQSALLAEGRLEPPDAQTAILVVHAINPYGFAWLRRVNEGNIDVNRNGLSGWDHLPAAPGYEHLHPHLVPREWAGPVRAEADLALARLVQQHGMRWIQQAVSGGQYSQADGLFYGGRAWSWSTLTWHAVLERFAASMEQIALIDLHSGLGPCGVGEIIYTEADRAGLDRAHRWYGAQVTSAIDNDTVSVAVQGALVNRVRWIVPGAQSTPVTLEFGTEPGDSVLDALRAEQWLEVYGDRDSGLGHAIKARLRDAFYPDRDDWKEAILERARAVAAMALAGLATASR